MPRPIEYVVRIGRTDNSATKTLFIEGKRRAFHTANSIAYVLWFDHPFKQGADIHQAIERDGFFIEICGEIRHEE